MIDNAVPVGNINTPKTYLKSLKIYVENRIYNLDISNMYDPLLHGEGLNGRFNGFCYNDLNCEFRAVFGDAGGTYAVEWHIENGFTYRSVLSPSNDIISLFKQDPVPPRYR